MAANVVPRSERNDRPRIMPLSGKLEAGTLSMHQLGGYSLEPVMFAEARLAAI
jgi:hypothetical protein